MKEIDETRKYFIEEIKSKEFVEEVEEICSNECVERIRQYEIKKKKP